MSNPFHLITIITLGFLSNAASTIEIVDDYCIYEEDEVFSQNCTPQEGFTFSTDPEYLATFEELIVPVVFWGINKDDGSSDDAFTLDKVNESLKLLNSAYKKMNIKFIVDEYKTINSSEIYWTDYTSFRGYLNKSELICENALNIYVTYRFTNFKNNLRGFKWSRNQVAVNMLNYNTGILPHEVGHIFGLSHTHAGFESKRCERVTRDKNAPEYNAHCAGDRVTDTNAMPKMYRHFNLINENCEYTGKLKNCIGELYQMTEDDIRNFMGYTQHDCRSKFSIGQGVRVRENILKYSDSKKYDFLIAE